MAGATKVIGRPMLNQELMGERFKKDKQYFRIRTVFTPNLKSKFYAPDEGTKQVDPAFIAMIEEGSRKGPKDKWDAPQTGNQCYGWHLQRLVDTDPNDRRLRFPRCSTEVSRWGAVLLRFKNMLR
ncbi:protein FAM183A-like [Schistocerca americana]|uniref:protein FAM183A-like n=1 Tax=Schistocerca americana TaxID=7009 RepID=UPI001F50115B|nr:protein FAM183A-like [Schistocerca americana]XP_049964889.1 protein FAM183A-like [Schistocerca serialis cubense]